MQNTFSPANLDLLFFGNECNISCRHCYYKEHGITINGRGIARDLETAKRLIRRHKSSSVFLYPVEITTSIETAELFPVVGQTKVLSNGIGLNGHMIERLKSSGIREIKITLFADHKTHAMFNDISRSQYRILLENIVLCKERGLEVVVNTVMTRSTISTIPTLIKLCSNFGVNKVEFLRLKPVGKARDTFEHELIKEPEMLKAIEMIEGLKPDFPKVYLGYNLGCGPDFYKKTIEEAQAKIKGRKLEWSNTDYMCPAIGRGYFGLSIRSGKIYGCLFAMEEEDFFLGNMDLQTGEITNLRENFLSPDILSEKLTGNCHKDNCVYHSICLGGCRSTAYLFAKRNGEKEPLYAGMDVCITKCKEKLGM